MDIYHLRGELYCAKCATDEMEGPVSLGEGESDIPHHCGECGVFLENPITDRGRRNICDMIAKLEREGIGDEDHLMEYLDYYDITESEIDGVPNSSYEHLSFMEEQVT